MTTSVTIDDELRKKIKKLAAELDTTQGNIVEQAIELLEWKLSTEPDEQDPKAREIIQRAVEKRKDIPWRKKIRKAIQRSGIEIDEMRISAWGEVTEN